MCIRDSRAGPRACRPGRYRRGRLCSPVCRARRGYVAPSACLLYTSDAADERSSVDLGGRRIIKKKKRAQRHNGRTITK